METALSEPPSLRAFSSCLPSTALVSCAVNCHKPADRKLLLVVRHGQAISNYLSDTLGPDEWFKVEGTCQYDDKQGTIYNVFDAGAQRADKIASGQSADSTSLAAAHLSTAKLDLDQRGSFTMVQGCIGHARAMCCACTGALTALQHSPLIGTLVRHGLFHSQMNPHALLLLLPPSLLLLLMMWPCDCVVTDLTGTGHDQAMSLNSMLSGGGWFSKMSGGKPVRAIISPLTRCATVL
jgi:hypothetical protein